MLFLNCVYYTHQPTIISNIMSTSKVSVQSKSVQNESKSSSESPSCSLLQDELSVKTDTIESVLRNRRWNPHEISEAVRFYGYGGKVETVERLKRSLAMGVQAENTRASEPECKLILDGIVSDIIIAARGSEVETMSTTVTDSSGSIVANVPVPAVSVPTNTVAHGSEVVPGVSSQSIQEALEYRGWRANDIAEAIRLYTLGSGLETVDRLKRAVAIGAQAENPRARGMELSMITDGVINAIIAKQDSMWSTQSAIVSRDLGDCSPEVAIRLVLKSNGINDSNIELALRKWNVTRGNHSFDFGTKLQMSVGIMLAGYFGAKRFTHEEQENILKNIANACGERM